MLQMHRNRGEGELTPREVRLPEPLQDSPKVRHQRCLAAVPGRQPHCPCAVAWSTGPAGTARS